jgi:predicted transcriptional regulator
MTMIVTQKIKEKEKENKPHNPHHRHRVEIINQILTVVYRHYPEGINKTRVMYHCELSSQQTRAYIPYLVENDLLTVSEDHNNKHKGNVMNLYFLTQKGLCFLKLYDDMHKNDLLYGFSVSTEGSGSGLQNHKREAGGGT